MIDIKSCINSLKCSWIKRLQGTHSQWKTAYKTELKKYGGDLVFKCNINHKDSKYICKKYSFLNQIIQAWCRINYKQTNESISTEILWHNTHIKSNNSKTIFLKDWYDKGIMYVHHIYDYRIKQLYSFDDLKDVIRY